MPFEKFTIDQGKILIELSTSLSICGAAINVQFEEHLTESSFAIGIHFCAIDTNGQATSCGIAVDGQTSVTLTQQEFHDCEMGLMDESASSVGVPDTSRLTRACA